MDKYRGAAEKKLKGQHPDMIAKEALNRAEFSSRERECSLIMYMVSYL